jgi:hypothetical protein
MEINNKITEIKSNMKIEKFDISKIKKYKNNNKLHTQDQIDVIRKSIVDF